MPERAKTFLLDWFATTLGVLVAANVVAGVKADTTPALLAASLLLGILHAFARPLLTLLTLPLVVLTLGLFMIVINALLLYLTGELLKGFAVADFWSAVKGAVVISIISFLVKLLLGGKEARVRTARVGRKGGEKSGGPVIDV